MGTGKSSAGRLLARELNLKFTDIDDLIEREVGLNIPLIFEKFGEPYFRLLEKNVIKDVALKESQIIATGGGAIIDDENLKTLKASGIVICLTASADAIFSRIGGAARERPLLNLPDRREAVERLMGYRKPFYAKADVCIDTTDKKIEEVVLEIKKEIKRRGGFSQRG